MTTEVKIVVVGAGAVGKTCMLMTYTEGKFPAEYVPTVFDNYEATIIINKAEIKLSLWDTVARGGHSRIRTLAYPKTDLFMICYAVNNRRSFDIVESFWVPELQQFAPKAAILLVATKDDLFEDDIFEANKADVSFVSHSEGKAMARKLHFHGFSSCSALKTNVKHTFDQAISISCNYILQQDSSKQRKGKCLIL